MSRYDVIISGAGPAGSSLAYLLARSGLAVLVLEKELMPREKPCGGGVASKVASLLNFPWQEVVEDTVQTVVLNYQGRGGVTVHQDTPVAYMVNRSNFDHLLAKQARAAGAMVIEGAAVKAVSMESGGVTVTAGDDTYLGLIFVGADGVNGASARLLGLQSARGAGPAVEVELECPPELAEQSRGVIKLDCGATPWGYGWIFPKKGRLSTGVGAFTSGSKGIKQNLNDLLEREGISSLRVISARGYPIPVVGWQKRKIYRDSSILLGDAAGLVDPFSGEGIYYAIKSAHLAAEAILENRGRPEHAPSFYQEMVERQITSELELAHKLAKIFYTFTKATFHLIERRPVIAERLYQIVSGNKKYSDIKSDAFEELRAITWGH
ncbi:MAG: putative oxidoreductase [Pelotomaculum sp. PtaB.Bin104]|nr:MAG: putative oxidoreductase [Pelotomaculum sp. PtaB.Bin104]